MATPPTLVSVGFSNLDTTVTPKSVSVTVQTGDLIVVFGQSEEFPTMTLNTPTGGSLTYTLQQSITLTNLCGTWCWTATATSNATFSVSIGATNTTHRWDMGVYVWRNHGGLGTTQQASDTVGSAPAVSLTTSANSAVCVMNGDWNNTAGAHTWRTVNGITPTSGSGEDAYHNYQFYVNSAANWSDTGAGGSQAFGLTAPTGQHYAIIAVEILAAPAASPTPVIRPTLYFRPPGSVPAFQRWAPTLPNMGAAQTINGAATLAGAGTVSALVTQLAPASPTGAGTLTTSAVQQAPVTPTGTGTLTASVVQGSGTTLTGAGGLSDTATQSVTAALSGSGAVTANSAQQAAAGLSGAGVLGALVTELATLSTAGAGTLTASPSGNQSGTCTMAGAGALSVAAVLLAPSTPAGSGGLTAPVRQLSQSAPAGAGTLTVPGRQLATVSAVGAGVLVATPAGLKTGTASLVGVGSLTTSLQPCVIFPVFTGITSPPSSGTTAYTTAATARPNTGVTTRPDTGDTPDPC